MLVGLRANEWLGHVVRHDNLLHDIIEKNVGQGYSGLYENDGVIA